VVGRASVFSVMIISPNKVAACLKCLQIVYTHEKRITRNSWKHWSYSSCFNHRYHKTDTS